VNKRFWLENVKEIQRSRRRWKDSIKNYTTEMMLVWCMDSSGSEYGQKSGFCGHDT